MGVWQYGTVLPFPEGVLWNYIGQFQDAVHDPLMIPPRGLPPGAKQTWVDATFPVTLFEANRIGGWGIVLELHKESTDNPPAGPDHEGPIDMNLNVSIIETDGMNDTRAIPAGQGTGLGPYPSQGRQTFSTWYPHYFPVIPPSQIRLIVNTGMYGVINDDWSLPPLPPPRLSVKVWEYYEPPPPHPPPPPCDLVSPWPYNVPGIGAQPGPGGVIRHAVWK